MIFHLRFIYCEDKGMPRNGIPFVEMLFFFSCIRFILVILLPQKRKI